MATGYTHDLTEETTLEDFALKCARAFGATILIRDEPLNVPIPEFQPSTFYRDELEKAKAELASIEAWTEDDARADQARKLAESGAMYERMNAESVEKRHVYNRMLALVTEWTPPTPDHNGLKEFMVEQLTTSREFDCHEWKDEPKPILKSAAWKARRVAEAVERVARYANEWQKEVNRTAQRNEWVRQLRDSLAPKAIA